MEDENTTKNGDNGSNVPKHIPSLYGCRSVDNFKRLNRVEEGTYGVVYKAMV